MGWQAGKGGRILIQPNGATVAVSITRTSGASTTVYSDQARTSSVAMPNTVSSPTIYWLDGDDSYTVSCKVNGIECAKAGTTVGAVVVYIGGGQSETVSVDIETAQGAAGVSGSYAQIARAVTDAGLHPNTDSPTYGAWFSFGNVANSMGGAATGSPAEGYAPFVAYYKFGDYTGLTNANVTKTTQAGSFVAAYYGPTVDDSAEALSSAVLLKDTGTGFTQAKKVTAFEADVQIEGANTVTGASTYVLGQGTRVIMNGTSHSDTAYGFKVSAATANNQLNGSTGTLTTWQGFRDDAYNPAGSNRSANESVHGLNRITSEQSFLLSRSSYGASVQIDLAGTGGGAPAVMQIQMPSPGSGGNTTTIADGAVTSASNLLTTATAPTVGWIGRVLTNANIPAATQVLNYYGTGPYTIVMNANATGTASSQSVTIAEADLVGLRINQAAAGTTTARPIEYYANGASVITAGLSRTGVWAGQGGFQVIDSSANPLINANSSGITFNDAKNLVFGTSTGTKIGTVGGASGQKIGFYNATPVVQPLLATGAAHTADDIITVLQTLGLARQS